MRPKTHDMIEKVKGLLIENEYQTSKQLGDKCALSVCSICRIVRLMRMEGIGVHTTKNGYILSKYAKKTDDVNFLRRLNGRRTSDVIAISASQTHIKKRWRSVTDRRHLQLVMGPLVGSPTKLFQGKQVLLTRKNGKGS